MYTILLTFFVTKKCVKEAVDVFGRYLIPLGSNVFRHYLVKECRHHIALGQWVFQAIITYAGSLCSSAARYLPIGVDWCD